MPNGPVCIYDLHYWIERCYFETNIDTYNTLQLSFEPSKELLAFVHGRTCVSLTWRTHHSITGDVHDSRPCCHWFSKVGFHRSLQECSAFEQ